MLCASELKAAIERILWTKDVSKLDNIPGLEVVSKHYVPGKIREYTYRLINEPRVEVHFTWEMYCGNLCTTYKTVGLTSQEDISLRMAGVVLERSMRKNILTEISFVIEQVKHAWDDSKLGSIPHLEFVEGDLSGTEKWHKHRLLSAPQVEILCRWDGRNEPIYRLMGADDLKVDLMLSQKHVTKSDKMLLKKLGILFKELTFQEERPCALPHLPPRFEATINNVLYRCFNDKTGVSAFMWIDIP